MPACRCCAVDRQLSVSDQVADCFTDHRDPERIRHPLRSLITQRIPAIALGCEDIDDPLRHDPLMALFSEKGRPDSTPLAGKSTLNEQMRSRNTSFSSISSS